MDSIKLSEKERIQIIKSFLISAIKDLREKENELNLQLGSQIVGHEVFGIEYNKTWVQYNIIPRRDKVLSDIEKYKTYAILHDIKLD